MARKLPPCFFCTMVERVASGEIDAAHALIESAAKGVVILGGGQGLATCNVCNAHLENAIAAERRDLRQARRAIASGDGSSPSKALARR
jgi:hypothetical protein